MNIVTNLFRCGIYFKTETVKNALYNLMLKYLAWQVCLKGFSFFSFFLLYLDFTPHPSRRRNFTLIWYLPLKKRERRSSVCSQKNLCENRIVELFLVVMYLYSLSLSFTNTNIRNYGNLTKSSFDLTSRNSCG